MTMRDKPIHSLHDIEGELDFIIKLSSCVNEKTRVNYTEKAVIRLKDHMGIDLKVSQ